MVRRPRMVRRLVTIAALVGVAAVVVWFSSAVVDASGAQMAAAGGLFAVIASGWSAAFVTTTAMLKTEGLRG
ncbi:MAG TPA: hypothetical protein H9800_05415 [Candidatus Microbacterium stercoravium]|uniref:Uncharacterized protein n=1 Tax=Candidatus Microbacterium stercoravium TaxID=2838697 RepID=A0A9D2H6E3_9MICO|nr:hypothetical protein [Candidatus Microbacterium stercoravium]